MDIVTTVQHRALTFVSECNRSGHRPSSVEIETWLSNPDPKEGVYRTEAVKNPAQFFETAAFGENTIARILEGMRAQNAERFSSAARALYPSPRLSKDFWTTRTRRVEVTPPETTVAHLIRLQWLSCEEHATRGDEVRITELGGALLAAAERDEPQQGDVDLIVLDRDDPLAYPKLVARLHDVGEGLLVDPYLEVSALHTLLTSTRLARFLVLDNGRNGSKLAALTTHLASTRLPREVEVRSSAELHDRVIVSAEGEILTIGSSINGLHKHTTALVQVPAPGAATMKDYYERLWSTSTPLGASRTDEDSEDDGGLGHPSPRE